MDITKANVGFSIEQLLTGKMAKEGFKVDYLPMWQMLDNWEKKIGGFDKTPLKDIFERIYEYAVVTISLDKADMQTRIDNLNEQNLKWFVKADTLELENTTLKLRISELERQSVQQETTGVEVPT